MSPAGVIGLVGLAASGVASACVMGWLLRRERAALDALIDAIDGDLVVPQPRRTAVARNGRCPAAPSGALRAVGPSLWALL